MLIATTVAKMLISLDRIYYSKHREIFNWLHDTLGIEWGQRYSIVFGYQEINLTQVEFDMFIDWLKPEKRKNGGFTGIYLQPAPIEVSR